MWRKIYETDTGDIAPLIARVFLGAVILPHGLQKLLGMFDGYGFAARVDYFTGTGIPAPVAVLIILGESFGRGFESGFLLASFLPCYSGSG